MDAWIVVGGVAVAFVVFRRLLGGRKMPQNVVLSKIEAGAKIVDVRTPDEYRGGAYPGAVNIPLQALAGRLGEIPKDRPVVVYCASGARSGSAAGLLARAGYDVVNAGGLRDMPSPSRPVTG
jgi:phage shock protein E